MRTVHRIASGLALSMMMGVGAAVAQYGPPPPPPQGYQQPDHGAWDAPPPEFREYQSRGYHDGVIGATKDYENHRRPTPDNRDEFRHPNVPRPFRHDYRDGFRQGYFAAVHHMQGGPGRYDRR